MNDKKCFLSYIENSMLEISNAINCITELEQNGITKNIKDNLKNALSELQNVYDDVETEYSGIFENVSRETKSDTCDKKNCLNCDYMSECEILEQKGYYD